MADKKENSTWWQSVPGILTASAGIITGLTVFVASLREAGIFWSDKTLAVAERQAPLDSDVNLASGAVAVEQDLCRELSGHALKVDTNNYPGLIGAKGLEFILSNDGVYRFSTMIDFSPKVDEAFLDDQYPKQIADRISGECKDYSTITFTRTLRNETHQSYIGKIYRTPDSINVDGRFEDEEGGQFLWSGFVVDPMP